MELVHKIRRKTDDLYFEEKMSWGDNGRLFLSTDSLMGFISSNPKFFDDLSNLEAVSYRLISHSSIDLTEWKDRNASFIRSKRREVFKSGGFLFAIMASNLNKTIEDDSKYILTPNVEGWFSVEEILAKTKINLNFIKKIVKHYTIRLPRSIDKSTYKQAFKLNDDNSMICFHKSCLEKKIYCQGQEEEILIESNNEILV